MLRSRRWGTIVLTLAAVLAAARVAMGVHYPTDVVAGAVIGAASAIALWLPAARRRLHALADFAGTIWDGSVHAVAARMGIASR